MTGGRGIGAVKLGDGLPERLDERLLDILMKQQVVRRYAGLSSVQSLSPGYAPRCRLQVGIAINHARTLAAQFQHDRRQMLRRGLHRNLAESGTAGEKDKVEALSEELSVDLPVAFHHGDIFGRETFLNHTAQYGRDFRDRRRSLQHSRAPCRNRSGERTEQQLHGIIPRRHYQDRAERLHDLIAAAGEMGEGSRDKPAAHA